MNANEMIDLSSNNPLPDLHALWSASERVLALKATEGTTYTWGAAAGLADAWHHMGGVVWWYHFAHSGSPWAQAQYFLGAVKGHTGPHDRLVADCEAPGVNGAWEDAFMGAVHAASPLGEEIYGSPYFLRDNGIRPHHGEGLWLAQYASKVSFIPTGWRTWDAWQFSQSASVPSEGRVDESHLAANVTPAATSTIQHNPYPSAVIPFDARPGVAHDPHRVMWLQWALHYSGHPVAIDGDCGNGTRAALLAFKRDHKLTADLIIRTPCHAALAGVTRKV